MRWAVVDQSAKQHAVDAGTMAYANGLDVERADLTVYGVVDGNAARRERYSAWARRQEQMLAALAVDKGGG